MKQLIARSLALLTLLLVTAAPAGARTLVDLIEDFRRETWHWQRVMGTKLTPTAYGERRIANRRYHAWVLRVWISRAAQVRKQASRPPHLAAWRCIQRYEGPWNDPNPPYYGGLQMDIGFQRRYGAYLLRVKGTADRWTPLEQMWVAERAHRSGRGFSPWPSTARPCGLL